MRIGIITFHFAQNHGAVLQAYGLQQQLRKMGHEASIIDYRPQYHTEQYRRFRWYKLLSWNPYKLAKRLMVEILLYPTYRRRAEAFARFEQEKLMLSSYDECQDFASHFDLIICGSDQIWEINLQEKRQIEGLYYGDGIDCPVIAYAPSFTTPFEGDLAKQLQQKLSNFRAISVREESARQQIQALTSQHVSRVVDPVLLAGAKCFLSLGEQRPVSQKYVFLYQVIGVERAYPMVCEFAKARGLKVVYLQSYLSIHHIKDSDQAASPDKFIAYIRHAEYVFSSSFHGTAFAILFHKPFYYLSSNNYNDSRSMSLLNITGLTDHAISTANIPDGRPIDYNHVDTQLAKEVKASEQFLEKALGEKQIRR